MSASPKQQLVDAIKDESARTRRLLSAFPATASEMRPHATSQSAREIVHTLCIEAAISSRALDGTLDLSKMGSMPPAPATWGEVLTAFDGAYAGLIKPLESTPGAELPRTSQRGESGGVDVARPCTTSRARPWTVRSRS